MGDWNWVAIGSCAAAAGVIVAIIVMLFGRSDANRSKRDARRQLRYFAANVVKNANAALLPESTNTTRNTVIPFVSNFFYKDAKIIDVIKCCKCSPAKMKQSFILFGDAGCGKTSIMQSLFRRSRVKSLFLPCNGVVYYEKSFISAPFSDENAFQDLLSNIKAARFSKLFLYIDGTDEQISQSDLDRLKNFIDAISSKTKNLVLRLSTRSYLLEPIEQVLGSYISRCNKYEACRWEYADLKAYVSKALKRIEKKTKAHYTRIESYFQNEINYESLSFSPLLCKLLMYNMLIDPNYSPEKNVFSIYQSFINNVQRYSKSNEIVLSDSELGTFANEVFEHFYNNELVCYLDTNNYFGAILKKAGNQKYTFVHQSFYEFFVAMHFSRCIDSASVKTVKVFTVDYSNSFADFITNALFLKDSKKTVAVISELYGYTIADSLKDSYNKEFTFLSDNDIQKAVDSLSLERFVTLKFMLVNRLGRLTDPGEIAHKILAFVYSNDNNLKNSDTLSIDDERYYLAVLKRCCAISASFLGLFKIECDFVNKMTGISNPSEYDSYYDLANRSHTLIYYGDCVVPSQIELSFRDDNRYSCRKACRKRLNRLLQLNDSPTIMNMNDLQKRLYCFRLFDIATLYCFAKSRHNSSVDIVTNMGLSEKDLFTLQSFTTAFVGDNADRKKLIEKLKIETSNLVAIAMNTEIQ